MSKKEPVLTTDEQLELRNLVKTLTDDGVTRDDFAIELGYSGGEKSLNQAMSPSRGGGTKDILARIRLYHKYHQVKKELELLKSTNSGAPGAILVQDPSPLYKGLAGILEMARQIATGLGVKDISELDIDESWKKLTELSKKGKRGDRGK